MEYGCILGPCFSLLCGWELWVTLLLRKELSIWSWGFFGAGLVITMVKHWSLVLLWLYSLHGLEDESSSWNCKEAALDFWGGCWFWRGVRWLYWPRGFSCFHVLAGMRCITLLWIGFSIFILTTLVLWVFHWSFGKLFSSSRHICCHCKIFEYKLFLA